MTTRDATDVARLRSEVSDLLAEEAQLLDERRYDDWFELLHDDYRYLVPQVVVREGADAPEHDQHAYLVMDSKASMVHKLGRRSSDRAWAMHPPAIEHRLVGSVLARPEGDGVVAVRSVVVVAFARAPEPPASYPATRWDRVAVDDGGWRFLERVVHLGAEVPDAVQLGVIY